MITILKGKEITVEWKVVSLDTKQPVDFEGVNAKVFLLAPDNIYTLPFDVVRDDFRGLRMNIPTSYISTGVYDIKVIWLKDALKDKPVYRNVSVKREAFALTDEASEVTYEGDTIKIATGVESCGRDGLSAYEIAVFRGFAKESSEKEWVESLDNVLASEASRVKAEDERVKAEDERVKGEDLRIRIFTNGEEDRRQSFEISQSSRADAFNYSEAQRQSIFESKEAQRDNNENSRMVKEEQRKIAETSRKSNEQGRETAESGRVSAESTRVADENIRKANEQDRVDAEKNRVNAETSRANAEVARVNTENTRKSNEQVRVSAENGRVSAEAAREAAEGVREATFQANEAIRQENETKRVDAEILRQEAEGVREATFQTNEAAREAEFGKAIQAAKDNLVVVNDLTTGGADKALSAEMGKELDGKVDELASQLNYNISVETKEGVSWTSQDLITPMLKDTKIVSFNGYAETVVFRTKNYDGSYERIRSAKESDLPIVLSSECDNVQMSVGGSLLIGCVGPIPSKIEEQSEHIGLIDEQIEQIESTESIITRNVGDIKPSVIGAIDLSLYVDENWIDDGANGWRQVRGYYSKFIKCYSGMKYKVIGNSAYNSIVSVITALPTTERESVSYAEGESRKKLDIGGTVIFTVGNDAKYICIMSVHNSNDVAPQLVDVLSNDRIDKLESTVDDTTDRLNELEENINADLNEIKANTKNELWNINAKFNYELNVETKEGVSWTSKTLDNPISKGTKIVSFNGYENKINFRKLVDGSFVVITGGTESDLPIILNEDCINVQMAVGGKATISLQGEIIQNVNNNIIKTNMNEEDIQSLRAKIGGEISVESYDVVKWIDDGANGWRQINNYTSIFIPCSKGETYHIVGNSVNDSFVSVITALPTTDREAVSYAEGESRRVLKLGAEVEFVIGEDARYVCVRIQNGTKDSTPQLIELLSTFQNKQGIGIELEKQGDITTISTKNNDPLEARLQALVYNPIIPAGVRLEAKILSLIHFSDVHGCEDNVKRIVAFQKKYNNYIDEILHTGDIAYSYWYWAYRWNEIGAGHILNTIGNHDAEAVGTGDIISEGESYNMYFKDYINNWGCQYVEGKCYYYKDYAAKSIRLIVIDCIHDSDAQRIWFADALNGALTNGYAVVCVSHYRPEGVDYMYESTTFCSYDIENNGRIDISYVNAVDSFIEGGGVFVTWLCGHTHRDLCGTLTNHPKQFVIVIENAQCGGIKTLVTGDGITYEERELSNLSETSPRKAGTITQDCFNVVSIDVSNKALKIFRVGSNVDFRGRVKDTLSWDFEKYKLVKTN